MSCGWARGTDGRRRRARGGRQTTGAAAGAAAGAAVAEEVARARGCGWAWRELATGDGRERVARDERGGHSTNKNHVSFKRVHARGAREPRVDVATWSGARANASGAARGRAMRRAAANVGRPNERGAARQPDTKVQSCV